MRNNFRRILAAILAVMFLIPANVQVFAADEEYTEEQTGVIENVTEPVQEDTDAAEATTDNDGSDSEIPAEEQYPVDTIDTELSDDDAEENETPVDGTRDQQIS